MKKLAFLTCAVLLTSMVMTSCKGDANAPDQQVPSVTTDIALALPSQVSGPLRMPSGTVQLDPVNDFNTNGMKGITLVPFGKKAVVTTASERLGENISLGAFSDAVLNKANDRGRIALFEGKEVPSGTSAFLFYGESNNPTSGLFNTGKLSGSMSGQPSTFSFWLSPILEGGSTDVTSNTAYTKLLAYLTSIAAAEDKEPSAPDYASVKKWYEYTDVMNEGYYELFQNFSSVKVLSSFGIRRMLEDLYKNLMKNAATDTLANNIKEAIANAAYATVNTTTGEVTLASDLQNFPGSLNLPDGAVAVAYNATSHAFVGNAAAPYGTNLLPAELDRYVYAPSLWYFANSEIKTSETSQKDKYVDNAAWATILAAYDKTSVNTKTRSIAIKDTIQYAVGRLDVQVKIKGGVSYLVDNNPITTGDVSHITHPSEGYPVSAVLVGGQKTVGFDFTPETFSGAATANAMTIYDKMMTNPGIVAKTTDYSLKNSTLVLETAKDADVYIAVEFTNTTGQDFYGADGIVPKDGKFYLVGTLGAATATVTGNKVFKQDYTTTAKLTIKDLKSAYNTIPDLKTPQLEIGLLVDLNWKSGCTYTVDFE